MKKQLFGLAIIASSVMMAAWTKPLKEIIAPEKTVSKNICVEIAKASNYTAAVYNDASAKVQVTVYKVSGENRSIVWQKDYDAKLLSQYPAAENAMRQQVVVNNVKESKEHLEVVYTLTYNSKGNVMQLQDGEVVDKGAQGRLFINI